MHHRPNGKKKGIRTAALLFLCLTGTAFGGIGARADVIWTPADSFFSDHRADCTQVERTYAANGGDGAATIWKAPGSDVRIASAPNGTELHVSFTYRDGGGDDWGVVEFSADGDGNVQSSVGGQTGWISMRDLTVVYDNFSFCGDHQGEFKAYSGELDHYKIKDAVAVWTYPGSGSYTTIRSLSETPNISYTYTDPDGQKWGYLAYNKGIKGWICLSAPEKVPDAPEMQPGEGDRTYLLLTAVLTVAVVAATAALLRHFWKKRTKEQDASAIIK